MVDKAAMKQFEVASFQNQDDPPDPRHRSRFPTDALSLALVPLFAFGVMPTLA